MTDSISPYNPPSIAALTAAHNDTIAAKHNNHKLDNSDNRYEEIHSPSTEYTDGAENNFYEQAELSQTCKEDLKNEGFGYNTEGFSARFLQELSTFEPLIESTLQISFDWEGETQVKSLKKTSWEEAPITVSRKDQSDAESECEEEPLELEGWSEKKDKLLKNLAAKCKYDWKKIAKKFNDTEKTKFTPLVLKQKYKDLTKVSIPLRVKFSHNEDLLIAKYFEIYGCDWAQMATHFPSRTAMMLKNRYYSHIRKRNLLNSMLQEVKETDDDGIIMTEETGNEGVQFIVESSQGVALRKFSMSNFNNIFFEFENELATELHDRITATSI